jgi:hypothetical protein
MLSVPSIIEIAKVSQYLAQNDIDDKGLYGGGIDLNLPQKLYNIRKSVEWMYDQDNTDPSLTGTSEYLLALCAKYRALAQINLQPQIITSTLNNFGNINVGLSSNAQFFTIRATNLSSPGYFDITSPSDFEISDDGITWVTNLSINYTTNTVNPTRVYVRFSPASSGYQQGYINILSVDSGAQANATVSVEGTGVVALLTAPSSLSFPTTAVLESSVDFFYLSGIYLENPPDNIVLTSPSSNYQLSLNNSTYSNSINVPYASTTLTRTVIYVKFIPQSTGVKTGNITIVGGGDSINVAVTGTGGTALLTATPSTITAFSSIPVSTFSPSKTFIVTGVYLQGSPNVVTVTSPSVDFQVSNNNSTWGASATIPFTSPTLTSTTVYVRFSPQSGGSKSGNVTVAGGGASTVNVAVSGAAAAASISATALTNFGDLGLTVPLTNNQSYSASQTTTVTGTGLDGTALTITGTTNFQISLNGTTWTNGALSLPYTGSTINTPVYVRFVPLTVGAKSENIAITGGGLASTVNITAAGTGVVEFYINVVGATRIMMVIQQSATTKIVWGDGTTNTYSSSGTKYPDRTYTSAFTGNIAIQMNAYVDITQFYMNLSGTAATSITINAFYFSKLTALTNCILDDKVSLIRYAAGAPMATSSLPQSLITLRIDKADIGDTVQGLPPGLTYLDIRENNTINGTLDELYTRCPSLTNILLSGSNTISGDIASIPNGVTTIRIFGNNTITCATKDLSVIPTSVINFRILGLNTIAGTLQDISHWSTIEEFSIGGVLNATSLSETSYINGTLNNITFSPNLSIFQLTFGVNQVSGQLSTTTTDATHFQLPAGIDVFEVRGESTLNPSFGNTLIAAIGDFPTGLTTLNVGGLNTISGNLNTYSSSTIRTFVIDGNNTISGSISSAPANVQFFQVTGNTGLQTYTASRNWGANGVMNYFAVYSRAGGYTGFTSARQSELNQLFIDLNVAQWVDSSSIVTKRITYPRQGTVVPTGSGATALTTLTTVKGVTVDAVTYP